MKSPKQKNDAAKRTSFYMPTSFIEAMNLIKNEKHVAKTPQVRVGLLKYFEEHRDFLLSHGVDPWKAS